MTRPNTYPEHPFLRLLEPNMVVSLISNGVQIIGRIQEVNQAGMITLDLDPWGVVDQARKGGFEAVPETGVPVLRTPIYSVVMIFSVQSVLFYPSVNIDS